MLRAAKIEDAESIGKIRVAAWQAAYQKFMPIDYLENLEPNSNLDSLRNSILKGEFKVLVAEINSKVVGFSIYGKPRYASKKFVTELWALNVLPEFWCQGVGRSLIQETIAHSQCQGFKVIELWCIKSNKAAERAYAKSGFKLTGNERISSQLTGHPIHELHYSKMIQVQVKSQF